MALAMLRVGHAVRASSACAFAAAPGALFHSSTQSLFPRKPLRVSVDAELLPPPLNKPPGTPKRERVQGKGEAHRMERADDIGDVPDRKLFSKQYSSSMQSVRERPQSASVSAPTNVESPPAERTGGEPDADQVPPEVARHRKGRTLWKERTLSLRDRGIVNWNPQRRLSREQMEHMRFLRREYPDQFPVQKLATSFHVSIEACIRILKSRWEPPEDVVARQAERKVPQLVASRARYIERIKTLIRDREKAARTPGGWKHDGDGDGDATGSKKEQFAIKYGARGEKLRRILAEDDAVNSPIEKPSGGGEGVAERKQAIQSVRVGGNRSTTRGDASTGGLSPSFGFKRSAVEGDGESRGNDAGDAHAPTHFRPDAAPSRTHGHRVTRAGPPSRLDDVLEDVQRSPPHHRSREVSFETLTAGVPVQSGGVDKRQERRKSEGGARGASGPSGAKGGESQFSQIAFASDSDMSKGLVGVSEEDTMSREQRRRLARERKEL
eukprot:Opistho-2@72459